MMKRERQCIIVNTSLEEILATCERHISNICKTGADLVDNEDGTNTDWFYIKMFHESWADLRDDVAAMIEKEKNDNPS